MSSLAPRLFLMRNAKEDAPRLMKTRWTLSYLRGPLTGPEISQADGAAQARGGDSGGERRSRACTVNRRHDRFRIECCCSSDRRCERPPAAAAAGARSVPARAAAAAVRSNTVRWCWAPPNCISSTAKTAVDAWQTRAAARAAGGRRQRRAVERGARHRRAARAGRHGTGVAVVSFAALPGAATRADSYAAWSKTPRCASL